MKNLIYLSAALTLLVFAGCRSIKQEKENTTFTANVKALSQAEGEKGTGECAKSITYMENSLVLYCGTCKWVPGKATKNSDLGYCN